MPAPSLVLPSTGATTASPRATRPVLLPWQRSWRNDIPTGLLSGTAWPRAWAWPASPPALTGPATCWRERWWAIWPDGQRSQAGPGSGSSGTSEGTQPSDPIDCRGPGGVFNGPPDVGRVG